MSLAAPKADTSHSIHSFATALQQLAARNGQPTPPLESFLTANAGKLARCAEPFKSPQASSRSKVEGGSFQAESGENVTLGEREKDVAKQLADKLQIDEIEAAVLLKGYRTGNGEDVKTDIETGLSRSDQFWEQITAFVLEEQLRVIQIVALLLRSADFEAYIPAEVVQRFTTDITTPQFAQALLERVTHLVKTPIPASAIPFSPLWVRFWVQQQKALLEVYFLLYYNRLFPNGKSFLSVLQYVQTTVWGSLQANEGLFDPEAQALAQDVVALSHLILIENMNLERAASSEAEELNLVPGQQLAEEEILHPKTLERIHQLIIALVSSHPRQSALLALAWAFVLFRITESISSVPLPETYYDIAQQILPADLQPRKDAKCAQANASQQALWQLLVTHALSPHVACLSFMLEILSSPLLSSNISFSLPTIPSLDPNLAGYLSVLRSVLASLSRLVHPSYLPSNDFDSFVAVFEMLYANPEAGLLRGNFWGLFAEAEDSPIREEEWQIFEVAAKRFPVETMPFTRMILALSGGRSPQLLTSPLQLDEADEAAALSQNCAEQTIQYLGQPQVLTQALPSLSPVMPLPYELSKSINATVTDIIATRPIRLSPSLTISPGTAGRIVSPLDQRPLIVSWDLSRSVDPSLSTFRFYGDCLKAFLANSQKKRPAKNGGSLTGSNDVFEGSHSHGIPESFTRTMDKNLSDLAYIVAILRNLLQQAPRKTSSVLKAMFGEVSIAIQTLCSILERAAPMEESETLFVVTVNVLTVLLRSYPDEIWLHLRSSDTIFPLDKASTTPVWGSRTTSANKSILVQDKIKGSYQRTLACLEMVQGLVLQAQWLADRDSVEAVKVKAPVLKRAMQWIAGSVWSSYTSWRYQDLRQKYELGSRLASVLTDLLHEADLKSRSSLNSAVELVLQILLIRPGQAEMSAFMSIINSGATILTSLQQLGRTADCVVVEACILNHLQLSNRLLQISRRIVKTGPTYLERLYFAHSNEPLFRALLPDASLDSIYILSAYVVTSENPQIATEAAGVLTKLCRLAADWGSPSERPSFLSHLGSIRDTESFLRKLLQLAGDPFVESTLQLATWRLLSAIAAHQPGFASILITGKQAVALVEASSSSYGEDSSTAASLALDVVRGWEEAWLVQPAILSASLTFLHEIWQNYITSSPILQQKRKESYIWSALLDIASRPLKVEAGPPREATSELDYAYRKHAQAAAVALYAVDMSYSSSSSPDSEGISTGTFIDFVGHSPQFEKWCQNAASCNIDLQRLEQTRSHLEAIVSTDSLDRYTHTQQLDSAPYGTDFYYDSNLLSKRLVGWISNSSTDLEAMRGAWANIREMNILWSMADGEAASLKSTVSCLQEILSRVPSSAQSCVAIRATCAALQGEFVMGSDSSALAEVRYDRSLRLLEVLVEYLARSGFHVETDFKMSLVSFLAGILSNETFTLEAGIRKSGVQYATSAFRLVNFTFKLKSEQLARSVVLKSTTPSNGSEPVETCLHACINACDFLITIAKEAAITEEVSQDMEWAVTALCEILSTPLAPSPSVWLAYCSVKDFFRHALDLVTSSSFDNSNIPFVRALLELLLAMAKQPLAAEKLALDGVVFSICNNAMTGLLEAGAVGSRVDANSDSTVSSLLHGLWRLFLCIVTQLAQHLGTSIPFMDQEVSTFVQMYRSQLLSSIQWTPDRTLTISDIKEHRAVLTLMAVCIRSTRQAEHLQASMQDLIQSMLRFLPQLVYLLQHPNLLVSLVESSIPAEISWLAADSGRADGVDLSELHSHPVVATLTQEVFSQCWVTVSMLISFTDAFAVLSRDRVDWPRDRIVISASANVALDEPASLGTLFDLARFCTDVTRHCTQSSTSDTAGCPLQPYDVKIMRETAEQCFEGTLLLMSTQIALTVQQQDTNGAQDRASQRARRDLKELASDLLEEFLDKKSSQPQPEKSLLDVLKHFVLNL